MKKVNNFWLPSNDTFFVNKPNYEIKETNMVLRSVGRYGTAIDVGAHCGYWSQRLSKKFKKVIAIEPVEEHYKCLERNIEKSNNVELVYAAASDFVGTINMEVAGDNSGKSRIITNSASTDGQTAKTIKIDDLNVEDVDFIKIDVEGHEEKVLLGCVETLKRWKPLLLVEIYEGYDTIEDILKPLGYRMIASNKYNFIWKHGNTSR